MDKGASSRTVVALAVLIILITAMIAMPGIAQEDGTFLISPNGTVEGTVKDQRSNAVSGATVELMKDDVAVANTTTDSFGNFQLEAPADSYLLSISGTGLEGLTRQVNITSGGTTELGAITVTVLQSPAWIVVDAVIIIGAIALIMVAWNRDKIRKKGSQ